MNYTNSVTSGIALGLSSLIFSSILSLPARADVYHAVAKGETLRTVAARYNTSPATLRAANVLQNLTDDAALPSMLLRVPEKSEVASSIAPVAKFAPQAAQGSTGWGKISSTTSYKVQAGDSWESIAAHFSKSGYIVTADMVREENPGVELAANQSVEVPLHRIVYGAVAKAVPARAEATSDAAAAPSIIPVAAGDLSATQSFSQSAPTHFAEPPAARDLPVARVVEDRPARYAQRIVSVQQSVTPKAEPKTPTKAQRRGPSVLGSRGRSSAETGGVRVLEQGEAAVVEPPTSQPRVIRPNAPAVQEEEPRPEKQTAKVARVAKVIKNSARIRRLPEAEAATLYNTPPGTELAVTGSKGSWISILMSDRSTGWLPAHYVNFTGARVDISSIKTRDPGTVTRTVRSSTGGDLSRYAAAHPAVAQALKWLGTPYVWGGTTQRGVDCSGLVLNAYRAVGYNLPRVSRDQAKVGQPVDVENLQPGDRLYFSASGKRIDHTGIYMGDGLFVHASGSGRRVMVSRLFDRGNWNIYVGARR